MNLPSSKDRWLRLSGIFLGGCILAWLPVEDVSTRGLLLFAIAVSSWLAVFLLVRFPPQRTDSRFGPVFRLTVAGILGGMAVTPIALFLAVFKIGIHAHPVPDFTTVQLVSVWQRTPIWVIGGALVGLGSGLMVRYRGI